MIMKESLRPCEVRAHTASVPALYVASRVLKGNDTVPGAAHDDGSFAAVRSLLAHESRKATEGGCRSKASIQCWRVRSPTRARRPFDDRCSRPAISRTSRARSHSALELLEMAESIHIATGTQRWWYHRPSTPVTTLKKSSFSTPFADGSRPPFFSSTGAAPTKARASRLQNTCGTLNVFAICFSAPVADPRDQTDAHAQAVGPSALHPAADAGMRRAAVLRRDEGCPRSEVEVRDPSPYHGPGGAGLPAALAEPGARDRGDSPARRPRARP